MKRALSCLLALTLAASLAAPAAAGEFPQEVTWTGYTKVEECGDFYNRSYRCWDQEGRMGILGRGGRVVLPCVYEDLGERFGWAKKDGKWGLMGMDEETGEIEQVLPFAYDVPGGQITRLWDGEDYPTRIAIQQNGAWGYADETGSLVIPCLYEEADDIHSVGGVWNSGPRRAIVKRDGKWGMIDDNGVSYWPFAYEALEGAIWLDEGQYGDAFMAKRNGKWGLIDLLGNELVPFVYDSITADGTMELFIVSQNGKYGFISKGSDVKYHAYPCLYDALIHQPYENYAAVQKDGKWGAVALGYGGSVPCALEERPVFGAGMAPARQDGGWRYLRIAGEGGALVWETALPGVYEEAGAFVSGMAPVKQNGRWGLISDNGEQLLPFQYDRVQIAGGSVILEEDGLTWGVSYALVPLTAKAVQTLDPGGPVRDYWKAEIGGKYGLYCQGETAAPFVYGHISYYPWGTDDLLVERDGRWGFLRDPLSAWRGRDLSIQWFPQFDALQLLGGGRMAVTVGEKQGLAALDGALLTPCVYTCLYADGAGGYSAYDGAYWGGLDGDGRVARPFLYRTRDTLEQGADWVEDGETGLYELQNNDGKNLAAYQYDSPWVHFEEGRAVVTRGGRYGVLALDGQELIPCVYDYVQPAGEGKFTLVQDGKVGFAGEDGDILLAPRFELVIDSTATMHGGAIRLSGGTYSGGVCAVYLPGDGGGEKRLTFINEAGETVETPGYSTFQKLEVIGDSYRGVNDDSPLLDPAFSVGRERGKLEPQGDGTAVYADALGNRLVLSGYTEPAEPEGQGDWVPLPADLYPGASGDGYTAVTRDGMCGLAKDPSLAQTVSDWAGTEVDRARSLGLVTGRTDRYLTYNITRLQFAELAVNLVEKVTGRAVEPVAEGRFTDTADELARKAAAAGIVSGTGDGGTFSPDRFITREELAAMLCRALEQIEPDRTAVSASLEGYADRASVSAWAAEAVAGLTARGILQGTAEGVLSPKYNTTVEQAILLVLRTYETGGSQR